LDSRNTSVFLTVSDTGISPNGDGFKDELEIGMYTNITDGIERWTLGIYSSDGSLVRELSGNSIEAVRTFVFDGTDEAGDLLSGEFFARFVVNYTKGRRSGSHQQQFPGGYPGSGAEPGYRSSAVRPRRRRAG
jgi:hypothetical protein